jgi:hypothetical protein
MMRVRWDPGQPLPAHEAHWNGSLDEESEEECELTAAESDEELDEDAFNHIVKNVRQGPVVANRIKIKYQRGSHICKRTRQREANKEKELRKAAQGCKPLTTTFLVKMVRSELNGTNNNSQTRISQERLLLEIIRRQL